MGAGLGVSLFDMVMALSEALDLVSPTTADHQRRVAYMSWEIAVKMGLPEEMREELILAGAVHDIGAISLAERLDILDFESRSPERHCDVGWRFLKGSGPLATLAPVVLAHHADHASRTAADDDDGLWTMVQVLHLADRVDALGTSCNEAARRRDALARIRPLAGSAFMPEAAEAFLSLASTDAFWLQAYSPKVGLVLRRHAGAATAQLDLEGLVGIAELIGRVVDYRSRFTYAHSGGVAGTSAALARLIDFDEDETALMRAAAYLHDLGKLAVPSELLEKTAALTCDEMDVIQTHPFQTFRILDEIEGMGEIRYWAGLHHERMDGSGYPFHLQGRSVPLEARIIALADVFSALREERPYRPALTAEEACELLNDQAGAGQLDIEIVGLASAQLQRIDAERSAEGERELGELRAAGLLTP